MEMTYTTTSISQVLGLADQASPLAKSNRKQAKSIQPTKWFNDAALVNVIQTKGLPYGCIDHLAFAIGATPLKILDLMAVPPRTAARRRQSAMFDAIEADRLTRIARVTALAYRVFGEAEIAKRWLNREHAMFAGKPPLDLLDTDLGTEMVTDELVRIEYGELVA